MRFLTEISALIQKEFLLEWRQKYALNGILLYLASTIFVCYLSFAVRGNSLNPATWNALFWIIMLFSAVNAISKSFSQERQNRNIYYYMLCSPQGIIISKIIYNCLIMIFLSFTGYLFYTVVLGNPVQDNGLFILNLILAAIGFSMTLTLISGIASKAGNSIGLMSILSLPVILPILLIVIRISKNSMDGLDWSVSIKDILVLGSINLILGALSYILFPYIWRS